MKRGQKVTLITLLAITLIASYGWFTSTKHIDIRFLKNGKPLSGLTLKIIPGQRENQEKDTFQIDQNGWVRLPASYVGKQAICGIKKGDQFVVEFFEGSFDRGKTITNWTGQGVQSTHTYRFLLYKTKHVSQNFSKAN